MSTKHTPGPWEYEDNECPWVFDSEGNTVAKIYSTKPDGVFLGDETKANARLIAASPQMHTLLSAFIAATEGVFECGHIRTEAIELMKGIDDVQGT